MEPDTNNQQPATSNQPRGWHFWFLVSFSLFLIVTFVYYLPTRFLYEIGGQGDPDKPMGRMMDEMMADEHMAGDRPEANIYHEEGEVREGLAVNLNVKPVPLRVLAVTQLDFLVNLKPGNIPVDASGLEIEHEYLMHVIGARSDLNEFFHTHPQAAAEPGMFSGNHVFQKPGLYKIWSEIKQGGVVYAFGHPEINVGGEGRREEKEVSFARNIIVGNYQVTLEIDKPVVKNNEGHLSFDIHTLTGQEVGTENYLGAKMHLALIKDDLKQFIHTHPEGRESHGFRLINPAQANGGQEEAMPPMGEMGEDEVIDFQVVLPEAGLYKAFAQFRPAGGGLLAGESLTAAFWIKVEENALSGISSWWALLIVSSLLIIILSLLVSRYLKVHNESRTRQLS